MHGAYDYLKYIDHTYYNTIITHYHIGLTKYIHQHDSKEEDAAHAVEME